MYDWLADWYVRLILNLRILASNPTQSETVEWLRTLSLFLVGLWVLRLSWDQFLGRRLHRMSPPCQDRRLQRILNQAARRLGLKGIRLLETKGRWPLVFCHGILDRAVFVAPHLARRLSEAEWDAVFTHELAHFCRRDVLRYWMRELVSALIPALMVLGLGVYLIFDGAYSRLVWWGAPGAVLAYQILVRLLDGQRERACDDLTVEVTGDPLALASALLRLNHLGREACGSFRGQLASSQPFLSSSSLGRRVRRLLDDRKRRRPPLAGFYWKQATAVMAVGLLVFVIHFHATGQSTDLIQSVWAAPCPSVLLVE